MPGPQAKLLLMKDFVKGDFGSEADVEGLRQQLSTLPGFDQVELVPNTPSTVFASVPARNDRERETLKSLVNDKVVGWRVIEEQSYGLPSTF